MKIKKLNELFDDDLAKNKLSSFSQSELKDISTNIKKTSTEKRLFSNLTLNCGFLKYSKVYGKEGCLRFVFDNRHTETIPNQHKNNWYGIHIDIKDDKFNIHYGYFINDNLEGDIIKDLDFEDLAHVINKTIYPKFKIAKELFLNDLKINLLDGLDVKNMNFNIINNGIENKETNTLNELFDDEDTKSEHEIEHLTGELKAKIIDQIKNGKIDNFKAEKGLIKALRYIHIRYPFLKNCNALFSTPEFIMFLFNKDIDLSNAFFLKIESDDHDLYNIAYGEVIKDDEHAHQKYGLDLESVINVIKKEVYPKFIESIEDFKEQQNIDILNGEDIKTINFEPILNSVLNFQDFSKNINENFHYFKAQDRIYTCDGGLGHNEYVTLLKLNDGKFLVIDYHNNSETYPLGSIIEMEDIYLIKSGEDLNNCELKKQCPFLFDFFIENYKF